MRAARICCSAGLLAVLGCDPAPLSVVPFYTPGQLTYDSLVLGTWNSPYEESSTLTVERVGYYRYLLTVAGDDRINRYAARIFRLHELPFVDVTLADDPTENPLDQRLHVLGRYVVRNDTLWFGYTAVEDWTSRLAPTSSLFAPDSSFTLLSAPPQVLQEIAVAQMHDIAVSWHASYLVRPASRAVAIQRLTSPTAPAP
jgi:hypothetical protein